MLLLALAILAAGAACGSSAPSASRTPVSSPVGQRSYAVAQVVHGPQDVDLTVLQTRIDPAGQDFPLVVPGRWISVRMAIRNGGRQPWPSSTLALLMDVQVRDQAGADYPASGTADGDQQIGVPVLPGESATGWLRFAVPAQGSLRLLWSSAGAEVALVN